MADYKFQPNVRIRKAASISDAVFTPPRSVPVHL
jgi:hypothetical protein